MQGSGCKYAGGRKVGSVEASPLHHLPKAHSTTVRDVRGSVLASQSSRRTDAHRSLDSEWLSVSKRDSKSPYHSGRYNRAMRAGPRTTRPSCSTRLGRSVLRASCRGRGPCHAAVFARACACSALPAPAVLHEQYSPRSRGEATAPIRRRRLTTRWPTVDGFPSVRLFTRTHTPASRRHRRRARGAMEKRCKAKLCSDASPLFHKSRRHTPSF